MISRKKHAHPKSPVPPLDDDYARALVRSKEARDHLQDLLERSDQKAGFVVTGIAFLGIFVQQSNFQRQAAPWALLALLYYAVAFVSVCVTAMPRKWDWYRSQKASALYEQHLQDTCEQELRESSRQESDLRAIYRQKNIFLMAGFIYLVLGMIAMQTAVMLKYVYGQ